MALEDFKGKYFVRQTTWFTMPSAARQVFKFTCVLHLFQSKLETNALFQP